MLKFIGASALVLVALASRAQAPGSGGPTPSAPTPDPTEIPLDGGASLLLAGGVAFGLKRLRRRA